MKFNMQLCRSVLALTKVCTVFFVLVWECGPRNKNTMDTEQRQKKNSCGGDYLVDAEGRLTMESYLKCTPFECLPKCFQHFNMAFALAGVALHIATNGFFYRFSIDDHREKDQRHDL